MKALRYLVLAATLLSSSFVNAVIISDFDKPTAFSDGWSVVYQGGYGTGFDYAGVLNSISAGARVALASSSSNEASTFDLFAATSLDTLQTITARNTTIFADDAYWYRNSSSVGFTPVADIFQCSADATGTGVCGPAEIAELSDLRLSWHGGLTNVAGGWRSGNNIWLNGNNEWQRYVLVQNVPEPSTLVLIGLGLAGLGVARRKKA